MHTVTFALDRSETGSVASFRYLYEAQHFVRTLQAAGYWVTFDFTLP